MSKKANKKQITATSSEFGHQSPKRAPRLLSSWTLLQKSCRTVWEHKKLFAGILGIYITLTFLFVRGFSGGADLTELRESLGSLQGILNQFAAGAALFTILVTSSGAAGGAAGAYQSMLLVIVSLAIIWALRQVMAGEAVRVRDTYYSGMYPLIPVLLVLFVIGLQLLPMLIGAIIYSLVVTNGIAVTLFEQLVWIILFFVLSIWSLYMVVPSVIALYISALPDMTPLVALRSAKRLVRFRRWPVLRRILLLPVALILGTGLIMLPVILLATPLAPWLFFVLSIVWIPLTHSYYYTLYRELLP